jgi:long-chain acyl-CoA synthetase
MPYTPRFTDLVTILADARARYADRPLLGTRKPSGWEWTTVAEFAAMVDACRGALLGAGIGRGDRVAVISNNRLEWAVLAYAVYGAGATYVPMYETQLDKEWAYILRDSGAKACFVANGRILERVKAVQGECAALERIVCFDGASDPEASFPALVERGQTAPATPEDPAPEDVACLIYTSGTTGNPKGVRLTHRNLAANVSAVLDVAPIGAQERSLAFLPWAHVYGGCIELNCAIATGNSLAICDDTSKLIDYLPEVQPTMLFAVPRIWNRIYEGVEKQIASRPKPVQAIFHAGMSARSKAKRGEPLGLVERAALLAAERLVFSKIVARFGGRLRFAVSGAAALSREVAEFIDNLGIQVYEGYGMTESSGATTSNRPGECRIGSVGKPVPGVEVKLDFSAAGASEGEGEIIIYGTGVMAGYEKLDDATRDALTPDGGLRTGDLGRFDADGFLYITGRVKELFKLSNGKYVAPAPLEEKLQLSPYIAQCVIYGDGKPHTVALVVPDLPTLEAWARQNGVPASGEALLSHPKTRELFQAELEKYSKDFKGYERVKAFFLEPTPLTTENGMLTPTLKLKRRNVMRQYADRFQSLY